MAFASASSPEIHTPPCQCSKPPGNPADLDQENHGQGQPNETSEQSAGRAEQATWEESAKPCRRGIFASATGYPLNDVKSFDTLIGIPIGSPLGNKHMSIGTMSLGLCLAMAVCIVAFGGQSRMGDFDGDSDLDLADFAAFQRCMTGDRFGGHHHPPIDPACIELFDWDFDKDVDLDDVHSEVCTMAGPDATQRGTERGEDDCEHSPFTCYVYCEEEGGGYHLGGSIEVSAPNADVAQHLCSDEDFKDSGADQCLMFNSFICSCE